MDAFGSQLQQILNRLNAGDSQAAADLLQAVYGQMRQHTKRMVSYFPGVQRWDETDDVLDGAMARLLPALSEVRPGSAPEFLALAHEEIRRELLDRARRYSGRSWRFTHGDDNRKTWELDATYAADEPRDLDEWSSLHEEILKLPAIERVVTELHWYHRWPGAKIAELLQVTVQTVRKYWKSAKELLRRRVST